MKKIPPFILQVVLSWAAIVWYAASREQETRVEVCSWHCEGVGDWSETYNGCICAIESPRGE